MQVYFKFVPLSNGYQFHRFGSVGHVEFGLNTALALRFGHYLCDKYGITDRAALFTGRIFVAKGGVS
jgi:hypothetical protein